jgi:hypothetical protein
MSYRSIRARAARAGLHAPVAWLRHRGLDSNDVLIASHGRTGNTMMRFILGEILSGVPSTFDTIQRIVPEMGLQINARSILPGGGRLIKTHEPYCRLYKRAIYMIRDVRDVLLSTFARETAADCIHTSLDDYVRPFMQGKMSHWGSWQAHVEGWINSPLAQSGDLLLVRFEDMRQDPEGEVGRCLEFLGKQVDASVIQTAIRNNSLQGMRAKEDQSKKFPKVPGKEGRQINQGTIGGWRQKLTDRQLEVVDEFAGDILARLNYPSSTSGRSAERKPPENIGQGRVNPANIHIQPAGTSVAWNLRQVSGNLQAHRHQSDNRALRTRVGGRIANFFCWYHY